MAFRNNGGVWTSTPNYYFSQSVGNKIGFVGFINNKPNYGFGIRLIKTSTTLTHGQTGTYTGNDGRVYATICIGTQEWIASNLIETKYRDGSNIPEVTDNTNWSTATAGARCSPNNIESNAVMYEY